MQPSLVIAADWSCRWGGRWLAKAERHCDRYEISHPRPVGRPEYLVDEILRELPKCSSALLGLDVPIGLPRLYARYRYIYDYREWLASLAGVEWKQFATVSDEPTPMQPFGPLSNERGGMKTSDLSKKLGISEDGLYRICERAHDSLDATSLFFTRFPGQVGKAALDAWSSVLRPNLDRVKIWPFDGRLEELLAEPGLVVAEIYPALMASILEIPRSVSSGGQTRRRKDDPFYRLAEPVLNRLQTVADEVAARFSSSASEWLGAGFASGDDFDALVSIVGMLKVVARLEDGGLAGADPGGCARNQEGWILGRQPTYSDETLPAMTTSLEEDVCCSAIGFLSERVDGDLCEIKLPDMEEREEQRVDRAFRIGDRQFVLEHSRVEAYRGRICDEVGAGKLKELLNLELSTVLQGGGAYDLLIPSQVELSNAKLKAVVPALAAWVRETAPTLEVGSPATAPNHFKKARIDEIGWEVQLYRWPGKLASLEIAGQAPGDKQLAQSLKSLLKKKLPKLEKARQVCQGTSVLLLEVRDLQLHSAVSVASVLLEVFDGAGLPGPDTILLHDSVSWHICAAREERAWIDPRFITLCRAP